MTGSVNFLLMLLVLDPLLSNVQAVNLHNQETVQLKVQEKLAQACACDSMRERLEGVAALAELSPIVRSFTKATASRPQIWDSISQSPLMAHLISFLELPELAVVKAFGKPSAQFIQSVSSRQVNSPPQDQVAFIQFSNSWDACVSTGSIAALTVILAYALAKGFGNHTLYTQNGRPSSFSPTITAFILHVLPILAVVLQATVFPFAIQYGRGIASLSQGNDEN
jgi:hypothetical protein